MDSESWDSNSDSDDSLCSGGSVPCSVCLQPVTDKGDRSIAKLACGHHFHLDCIGSAFNAKGAMQCPNCRHIENGQWLYAKAFHPFEEYFLEEWTSDEDFHDTNYTEAPFGIQWCPYQGAVSELSVSPVEVEPSSGDYSDVIANTLYGEHVNLANSARVCPYLAMQGISRARQLPVPVNASATSSNPGDVGIHHRNGVSAVSDPFGSQTFPTVETRYHNWLQSASFPTYSGATNTDRAAPLSPLYERLARTEADRLQSTGPFARFGHDSQGSYEFGHSQNITHGLHRGHVYQPQSVTSPMHSGLNAQRGRPRGISFFPPRTVVQSTPAEQGRIHTASLYGAMRRQDIDNLGWHQHQRSYGQEREGFPSLPRVPLNHDLQWGSLHHASHNPQTIPSESVGRSYHPHGYIGAERGAQRRSGMLMDSSHQHHVYPRFTSSFP